VRKLEFFFVFLVFTMGITFWINMIRAKPDAGKILKGTFLPIVPAGDDALNSVIGMFGAVIMPHNLYLHSALVLTRKINMKSKDAINEANIYNNIESSISLLISFLVTLAVVSTFAVYLENFPGANTDMNLEDGGNALVALLKTDAAKYVWAVGLLAAG
jgi:natural resistance-associated macrophage protein